MGMQDLLVLAIALAFIVPLARYGKKFELPLAVVVGVLILLTVLHIVPLDYTWVSVCGYIIGWVGNRVHL